MTNVQNLSAQALAAVQDIHTMVATNGAQVAIAVTNLVYFSSELSQFGSSAQGLLATNGENVNVATKNLEDMSETLKHLANELQAGNGLAGTVLQNQDLATNVQTIAANLSITSSNLNRLGLWGILWSHKPSHPATNNPAHP